MRNAIHNEREEAHRQNVMLTAILVFVFFMILGYLAYASYKIYQEHEGVIYDTDSASISLPAEQHN